MLFLVICIPFRFVRKVQAFIQLIATQKSLHAKQNTPRMLCKQQSTTIVLTKAKLFLYHATKLQ